MELNRRTFLKTSIGSLASLNMANLSFASKEAIRSTVAVVKDDFAVDDRDEVNRGRCRQMIKTALKTLTGKSDEAEAWAVLGLVSNDVVAIKLNCNNTFFPLKVHPDLTYAVSESLSTVIPANNVIIYERYTWELQDAGYEINSSNSNVRCISTAEGGGFHNQSKLTNIVADQATKVIHIPTLKYIGEEFQAVLFLKDHIGSIPPSDMPSCHGNPLVCTEILAHPHIKDKNLLNICDGLRGTYETRSPWFWKGIVASKDPIAAEVVCLNVLDEKRKLEGRSGTSVKSFVTKADTDYHLGTANYKEIEVIEEDISITPIKKDKRNRRSGSLDGFHFPNPVQDNVRICFTVPDNHKPFLNIFNEKGQHIRTLDIPGYAPGSRISMVWNRRDLYGRQVSAGHYYWEVAGNYGHVTLVR